MSIPSTPPPKEPLQQQPVTSSADPTGQWAKFLSGGGMQATAEDVKRFIDGIMKMFGVLLQQQARAAKESARKMRDSIEGNE